MLNEEIQTCLKKNLSYPDDRDLHQRGVADKIEQSCNAILTNNFSFVTPAKSRRSIEDITINDTFVDHKSSDSALEFKMPNLISIARLKKLDIPLLYNFVNYDSSKKQILNVVVMNVYELNWDHLKIQNLGTGQLQIKNMGKFMQSPKTNLTKEEWIERLYAEGAKFYDELIEKTKRRKKLWLRK
jgi:hypothetical protein